MKLPNLKSKKILILAALLIGLSLLAGVVKAQEMVRSITVMPPTEAIPPLNPGEKWEGVLHVINQSTNPLTFTTNIRDYIVVDKLGTPNLLPPGTLDSRFTASDWIVVDPAAFTLAPGQRQDVNYYLHIPYNARPGGHYAAVTYTPSIPAAKGTGVAVQQQITTLFYITVKGPIKEDAKVTNFTANYFQEYGPVKILTEITNNGDLHINPTGYIKVSDMLGRVKILPLDSHNIFPGGVARDYENSFSGLFIGKFKAELVATYGVKNNLPLTAVLYFWIFPWKLTIIVILIIVVAILLALYLRKKKRSGKPEKPEAETAAKEESTEKEKKGGVLKEYHSPSNQ